MKTVNIIVGAVIFFMVACSENRNRIEDISTEANETTLDETVASGGQAEESMSGNAANSAASETNRSEGLVEVALPQFEDSDIKYFTGENYSIYSIGKTSLFATGSASLRSGADQSLEKLSSTLLQRNKEGQISMRAYIDASENPNFKTDVAQRRLQAVKDWLINQGNIDGSRITEQDVVDVGSSSTDAVDAAEQDKEYRIEIIVRDANK